MLRTASTGKKFSAQGLFMILLVLTLLFSPLNLLAEESPGTIQLDVDGEILDLDVPPRYYLEGRLAVPLRAVMEALGATVTWDEETQGIAVNWKDYRLELQAGSSSALFNDSAVELDTGVFLVSGRSMVPLRCLGEILQFTVDWDQEDKVAVISSVLIETITWDDGTYTGQILDGKPHGAGTWVHEDGARYEGEFKEGFFHGQGKYVDVSGTQYSGGWKKSLAHGYGTFYFPEVLEYTGELKEGVFHGQGTLTFFEGEEYVGEFQEGRPHGRGTVTYPDGTVEEGLWEHGALVEQAP